MENSFPKLSLILGGANSGKSGFAEKLVRKSCLERSYLATAQAFDEEMRAKIIAHQLQRGEGWKTIEEPLNLVNALQKVPSQNVILIDCFTLWLSNHLIAEKEWQLLPVLQAMEKHDAPVVCVSNITGLGVIPETSLGRKFQADQGQLNQKLAAAADYVVSVTAGLPMVLKGTAPEGLA